MKRYFCMILSALTLTIQASAWSADTVGATDEYTILANWKTSARQSAVGNKLADLFNSTSTILKTDPRHKQALYLRGYLYGVIGCTGLAIADLSKAIEVDPTFAAARTERGICYMDLKRYDLARLDLDKAVALNPSSGDARFAHGKLMLEMDNASSAASDFRACQSAMCKFTPALPGELPSNYYNGPDYYLGVCYEAMGRGDQALKYYKASIKTNRLGGSGYIKRYSDQPLDASARVSTLEVSNY